MIAIITEKPLFAKEIARIVGATKRETGYMSGNGYLVTWTLGHLLTLAMPKEYGLARAGSDVLPILPPTFLQVVRQVKTSEGLVTDQVAVRRLKIISTLFDKCDSIIVATDSNREGECVFRNIYHYLGCKKPFSRLWLTSLTDEAIIYALENLRPGKLYSNLYHAADCRAKLDWLLGVNASQALSVVSGVGNHSLGRVQTPVLAAICERYRENRGFVSEPCWQFNLVVGSGNRTRLFRHTRELHEKETAEQLYALFQGTSKAQITAVKNEKEEWQPPMLYNLTDLQRDANLYLGLTADRTLAIAQNLYEKRLITHPKTSGRHIPQEVFSQMPFLLRRILAIPEFRHYRCRINMDALSIRLVGDSKATGHHALITTGVIPEGLSKEEKKLFQLIAGRMLEAFSTPYIREVTTVQAECNGQTFCSRSYTVVAGGWRHVFGRKDRREAEGLLENLLTPSFSKGESVSVSGFSLAGKKPLPPPLHTDATLLEVMENSGLGTPATRANTIQTLLEREYIERCGGSLLPTEKGLFVYQSVGRMSIADASLTATWEEKLEQIEAGTLRPGEFMRQIKNHTRMVTKEVLALDFRSFGKTAGK